MVDKMQANNNEKEVKEERKMRYGARYAGTILLSVILGVLLAFFQIDWSWIFFGILFLVLIGLVIEWRLTIVGIIMSIILLAVGTVEGITWLPIPILTFLFLVGLFNVPENHRAVIERFRKFNRPAKEGLRWILLPGIIEAIKEIIFIEEQRIPIYPEPIEIDFVDGSSAPKNAIAYIRIYKPDEDYELTDKEGDLLGLNGSEKEREKTPRSGVYRATYYILEHYIKGTQTLLANSLRSYLNSLVIDEGLSKGRAGYNLLQPDKDGKERIPQKEVDRIKTALKRWGVSLFRVTVEDFDLPPALVTIRQERHKKEKEKEASPFVAERRAEETVGTMFQMLKRQTGLGIETLQEELRKSPKRFIKKYEPLFRQNTELIHRRMGIDGKALVEIITRAAEKEGGNEDILDRIKNLLLSVIAAWKRMPPGISAEPKAEGEISRKPSERIEEIRQKWIQTGKIKPKSKSEE